MKIRTKLAIIFFVLVIFLVSAISITIYFSAAIYRSEDFNRRLKNRAINTAQILLRVKEIDANLLMKIEKENPASLPMQFVTIYNVEHETLYTSDTESVMPFDSAFLRRIQTEQQIQIKKNNYEVLAFHLMGGDDDLLIIAGARDVYGIDALNNLRNVILVTFITSLGIVSVLGWFFSARMLRPIAKIVDEVGNITAANLNQRLDEGNGKDELSKLANTFNDMLSRLESAFEAQKSFIANASHELKTPFTVMAGEIEVTLLQKRDNEYYLKILRSVLKGIKKFNTLCTQLLLLTQTSADVSQKRFSLLRVDDFIWEAKEELQHLHPEYNIEILFDLDLTHDVLSTKGDEQLLKVLLINLMDNACKYSDNNSVKVTLSASSTFIFIKFINTGPGIEDSEIKKIFDPFYRGKFSKKSNGFGVGLSLALNIANLHGSKISVTSAPGNETVFVLTVPIHT
jgi:signal transduction histidine kinase